MAKLADALEKARKLKQESESSPAVASVRPLFPAENHEPDRASTPDEVSEAEPRFSAGGDFPRPASGTVGGPFHEPDPLLLTRLTDQYEFSEQFRMLRTLLIHRPEQGAPPRTIMVTSAAPGEGKTMIASNLAVSIAMGMEEHVLLVDADLRKPSLHKFFGVETDLGLADYLLNGDVDLRNVLRKTPVDKLTLLPAGETGMHSPAELLASERMRRLVEEVKTRYDDRYIIFDTPPVQATTEPSVLAGAMDCVLMVVRRNGADKAAIEESIELLGRHKVKGVLFNGAEEGSIKEKYKYSYYHYGYRPDESKKRK